MMTMVLRIFNRMIPVSHPKRIRAILLVLLTILALGLLMLQPPVPQDPAFHSFADKRAIFGVPNFYNVSSNLFFLLVSLYGFTRLGRIGNTSHRRIYLCLFVGVLLTAFGSAYYHYNPDNNTLVWDRIPMTIIFMSFLSAAIGENISLRTGVVLLLPLLAAGAGSVLYWQYTESVGKGDLRLYGFMQYYPMLLVPLIYLLYPAPGNAKRWKLLGGILLCYLFAKLAEHFDGEIFDVIGISGHSIKHVFAAGATLCLVYMPGRKDQRNSATISV